MAGALNPSLLDQPVTALPGAGPVTAARLAERGLATVRDLLAFLPVGYEDFRTRYPLSALASLPEGQTVVVQARVRRIHRFFRRLLDVYLEQDGAKLRARWFRPNAGMAKTYAKGNLVALAGTLRRDKDGSVEMVHPRNVTALLAAGNQSGLALRPRYSSVEKVPGRVVEKLVAAAVERAAGLVPDVLPAGVVRRFGFPSITESLRQVHQPEGLLSDEKLAQLLAGEVPAQRRLAFEDLFVVQVGLALERARAHRAPGWRCDVDGESVLVSVRAALPFAPTLAQERAIRTVFADLTSATPMQRLLQGDVGSGKTAVAFAAALLAARAGGQSLLMAPTEVLAEQHGRTLVDWGNKAGLRVAVLHAGLDAQARRRVLAAVASGETDLLVGTHALLEESLRVKHLALAIVDEQHRFGVRQRAALRRAGGWIPNEKTGMVPHLLVLSATPIPRSLALTAYGDLDLVTLDESPPGRQIVATHLGLGEDARREAMAAVKVAVAAGGQGFVVCPAIAEQKHGRRASVLSRLRELRPLLAPARVGLLHGQMPSAEQAKVVAAFRAGQLDVLVATTVLEVGVDVPRASIIVIEDAERFGLAQLHQLRGRVGRAGQASSCHLLSGAQDPETLERLAFVAATSNGFSIAEEDLRRRGPGEIYGERQTGVVGLWMRDPAGLVALVERARQEAQALLAEDPDLASSEHAALRQAVEARWRRRRPIAEEAG
ncbi:MAG: ATP-dependent DNA helicase RecG [Polyangia bacterium]